MIRYKVVVTHEGKSMNIFHDGRTFKSKYYAKQKEADYIEYHRIQNKRVYTDVKEVRAVKRCPHCKYNIGDVEIELTIEE